MLRYTVLLATVLVAVVTGQTASGGTSLLQLNPCATWYPLGGNSQRLDNLPYTALCSPTPDGTQIIMQIASDSPNVFIAGVVATAVHDNNTAWTDPNGFFTSLSAGYTVVFCADRSESLVKNDFSDTPVFSQSWNVPANAKLTDVKCRFLIAQTESTYWNDVIVPSVSALGSSPVVGGAPQQQASAPVSVTKSTTVAPVSVNATVAPVSENATTTVAPVSVNTTTTVAQVSVNTTTTVAPVSVNTTTTVAPVSVNTTTTVTPVSVNTTTTVAPVSVNTTTTVAPVSVNTTTTVAPVSVNTTTTVAQVSVNTTTTVAPVPENPTTTLPPVSENTTLVTSTANKIVVPKSENLTTAPAPENATITPVFETTTGSLLTKILTSTARSVSITKIEVAPLVNDTTPQVNDTTPQANNELPDLFSNITGSATEEVNTIPIDLNTTTVRALETSTAVVSVGLDGALETTVRPNIITEPATAFPTTTGIPILPKQAILKRVQGVVTNYWCEAYGSIYVLVPGTKCTTYYVGNYANSNGEVEPLAKFSCIGGTKFSSITCGCDWSYDFICPDSQ